MYGGGGGPGSYGAGTGVGMGVGVGVAVGVGVGVGVGVIVGLGASETRARVPHRRTDPIATLSRQRSSVRTRVVNARLRVRPRVTVPFVVATTVGRTRTRAPNLVQVPE